MTADDVRSPSRAEDPVSLVAGAGTGFVDVVVDGNAHTRDARLSTPRCFETGRRLLAELDIPLFHGNQHGTAIVVLVVPRMPYGSSKSAPRRSGS